MLLGTGWLVVAFQVELGEFYALTPDKELYAIDASEYRTWHDAGSAFFPPRQGTLDHPLYPGIHHVYIDPISLKGLRDKGEFPAKTIIVMENLHVERRESEAGEGYFTVGVKDVLVAIKDRRTFGKENWGYYLFLAEDLEAGKETAQLQPRERCLTCHLAGASFDQVFSQYYPDLSP